MMVIMRGHLPADARFLEKVTKSDCWEWGAAKDDDGYGRFWFYGRMTLAHRWAYERWVGPIPEGVGLDHKCRNHGCVNPGHVRPADQKQNMENQAVRADNQSGYRGVTWNARLGKWQAKVGHQGRTYHVGYFEDPAKAGEAATARRMELFTHNELDRGSSLKA